MPSNTPSPRCSDYAPGNPPPLTELFTKVRDAVLLAEQKRPPQPEKIEASWDKWLRYVDLFTTQGQQEQFGMPEWHRDYKLIRDLEYILKNGQQQVTSFWNACVKYRWNRFERIFSRRYHYSVPGVLSDALSPGIPLNLEERATKPGELSPVAKILATKRVTFTLADKNVLENRLCFSCLVDVDRVPPRLMSALGIIKWDRARRMRGEDVLQEIKKPEHLVRLKLIFDAAKRIDAGERFIVVQKPSDALLDVYCRRLRAAGETKLANSLSIPDEAIGKILVISEEVSGSLMQSKPQLAKLVPVPLKVAVVDSIYAARRGTHHAAVGYAAERETLAKAAANIEHIRAFPEINAELQKHYIYG